MIINLNGELPSELQSINTLASIDLSGNTLNSIAAGSDLSYITGNVDLSRNALDFTDLSLLSNTPQSFFYSPQEKLDELDTQFVATGESIALTVSDAATGNNYQWFKDDQLLDINDNCYC